MQEDHASQEESFAKIPEYLERLRAQNPAADDTDAIVTDRVIDQNSQFQRVKVCPQRAQRAFAFGLPFVALDGMFLKTRYCQTLLLAVSWDGNNELSFLAVIFVC
jgi:hypothetical protein